MVRKSLYFIFGAVIIIIAIAKCTGGNGTGTPCPPPCVGGGDTPTPTTGPTTGQVYVINNTASSILRFSSSGAVTGNTLPASTITGAATTLSSPTHAFYDVSADHLYISNPGNGTILVYSSPNQKGGTTAPSENVAPSRTIGSGSFSTLGGITYGDNAAGNRLYVAGGTDKIFIFNSGNSIGGPGLLTPDAIVTSTSAMLTPAGLFLDKTNNRLYVCDSGNNRVLVFANASGLVTGAVAPLKTFTGFSNPISLVIDNTDHLIVSNNTGDSIFVINGVSALPAGTTAIAADKTFGGGSTTIKAPKQIFYQSSLDALWVANNPIAGSSVLVFEGIAGLAGSEAPTRTLSGSNTGFSAANSAAGVVVDTAH